MVFARYKLLTAVAVIAVLAGLFILVRRHAVESRDRAVEIAVDYNELESLASATGRPLDRILSEFRRAGATSVAVQEMTVNDLMQDGRAVVTQAPSNSTLITVTAPDLASQVAEYIDAECPSVHTERTPEGLAMSVRGTDEYVRALPLGFPRQALDAEKEGLAVVGRLVNYTGVTQRSIAHSMFALRRDRIKTVVFGGDQILGFRGLIPEVADAFKANGLYYGAIEFSRQKGDDKFSRRLADRIVRVHSISSAELPSLDMPSAVERYVRAVKERNIRLLYVRLFDTADSDPVAVNAEYIGKIRTGIENEGFALRQAHSMGDTAIPRALMVLLAAGTAAGAVLLLGSVVELGPLFQVSAFAAAFLFLAALGAGMGDAGRKLVALGAAVVFPTLAVIFAGQVQPKTTRRGAVISSAVGRFFALTAITVSGGVIVASLLSSRVFMLKLNQFAGVKAAQLLPILIIGLVYAAQIAWTRATWQEQKNRAKENLQKLLSEPIRVWQAAAVFVALVLVALVLARSGNEPGVGVSAAELKFRALLDHVLFVRPRTKEFLFGHPVMILAIGMVVSGRRRWAVPLFVLGTIGQVSILNTFCHIHTPIVITVLRVAIGSVLGAAAGLVLLWIVLRLIPRAKDVEALQ